MEDQMNKLNSLRKDYAEQGLTEDMLSKDPVDQFKAWLDEAIAHNLIEPNAMCVATVGPDLRPSNRFVLLKNFDQRGFVFYTNKESRKSQQIKLNPYVAATFWWGALERSVRIEGEIEECTQKEDDDYFNSRCRGAQIGAWTSLQSQEIESREALEAKEAELKAKFETQDAVTRPPHWGGWRIKPTMIEFWKGRSSRLHDRLVYTRESTESQDWSVKRLQP